MYNALNVAVRHRYVSDRSQNRFAGVELGNKKKKFYTYNLSDDKRRAKNGLWFIASQGSIISLRLFVFWLHDFHG